MRRFITGELPDRPLPAGLELRPVTPDQHRAIFDADNEAFRDHWGHREADDGDFRARFEHPETDTSLWCVAWDGDQVAGSVMNAIYAEENEQLGIKRGWLDHVSVRRQWRGKGVAKALCAASFAVLRDHGMEEAWLGRRRVEPDGRAPAVRGPRLPRRAPLAGVRASARRSGGRGVAAEGRRARLDRRRLTGGRRRGPSVRSALGPARFRSRVDDLRMRGSATHRLIAIPALVALLAVAGVLRGPGGVAHGAAGSRLVPQAPRPLQANRHRPPSASSSASDLPSPTMSPSAAQSPTPEATMPDFALTSTAFEPGGAIPKRFTCDGEDGSPDLAWTGAPDGTGALVLIVDDPDARGWVHWIVLDMAGTSTGALARGVGVSPDAPAQGRNDFGRIGWGGPCPPSGTHRYDFTLYALAEPLSLPGQPDGGAVRKALDRANVLGKAVLEATYQRGG